MAKSVTIEQFNAWYANNIHRTWDRTQSPRERSMEVKYFYFSFDTRDGKIFHIGTNKKKPTYDYEIYGSHHDDHDTVLTALEARMDGKAVGSIHASQIIE